MGCVPLVLVLPEGAASVYEALSMSATETDESLMERYVAGDARALSILFGRYAPRLHAFFVRSVGESAGEDLLQSTFLKVHRARHDYVAGMPVRPWLFTIAARTRADELRRRYRARVDAHADPETLVDTSGLATEDRVLAGQVRRAIESLPEGQRLAVWLHRFEGLSFAEIAAVLSELEGKPVKEGAARIRAFRAYETLRAQLADTQRSERA